MEHSRRSPPPAQGAGKGRVKGAEQRVEEAVDHKSGKEDPNL